VGVIFLVFLFVIPIAFAGQDCYLEKYEELSSCNGYTGCSCVDKTTTQEYSYEECTKYDYYDCNCKDYDCSYERRYLGFKWNPELNPYECNKREECGWVNSLCSTKTCNSYNYVCQSGKVCRDVQKTCSGWYVGTCEFLDWSWDCWLYGDYDCTERECYNDPCASTKKECNGYLYRFESCMKYECSTVSDTCYRGGREVVEYVDYIPRTCTECDTCRGGCIESVVKFGTKDSTVKECTGYKEECTDHPYPVINNLKFCSNSHGECDEINSANGEIILYFELSNIVHKDNEVDFTLDVDGNNERYTYYNEEPFIIKKIIHVSNSHEIAVSVHDNLDGDYVESSKYITYNPNLVRFDIPVEAEPGKSDYQPETEQPDMPSQFWWLFASGMLVLLALPEFIRGFAIGSDENSSLAGIAGDIASGILIWGDIRDSFYYLKDKITGENKYSDLFGALAVIGLGMEFIDRTELGDSFLSYAKVLWNGKGFLLK